MAEATVLQMPIKTKLVCSSCGSPGEGSCRCGAPYVTPGVRAEAAVKANPEKSDRIIAEEIGVEKTTVLRARRNLGGAYAPPEKRKGKDGKSYTAKRKARPRKTDPVKDQIAALADQGLTSPKIAASVGIDGRAVRHAIEREDLKEAGRQEAFIEIVGTADFTNATAKQKLEAAKRLQEYRLSAQHAARMKQVDEEVRQRVLKEGKEYLAMVKEKEDKAWETEKFYRELTNNRQPLFSLDQFNLIRKCLHQGGVAATPRDFDAAFDLIQKKKLQLTGQA